ncbi:MAG: gamma-glutamyl-gamma-aminobutyrate hydrolase family protein [Solobacterium sp.]|nr:gamma-glutamyl-gamma-aminobutyrate hydrolase family protein [Solobacterium sp.]
MKKPLIAMSVRMTEFWNSRQLYNGQTYYDYILKAGGIPASVYADTEETAQQIADRYSGLVLTGGEDCDPALYGEENTHSDIIDPAVEKSDILLYRAFVKAGKPILAICRGIQLIAAAEGCSLIQDIPEYNGNQHNQRQMDPPLDSYAFAHENTFVKGTHLHAVFSDSYRVNTFHHQALRVCPPGYTVSSYSYDGLIEGIEKDRITGVQWHPERLAYDPKHLKIAQDFIRDCSDS